MKRLAIFGVILSFLLLFGRQAVSGNEALSKEVKQEVDEPVLAKLNGWIMGIENFKGILQKARIFHEKLGKNMNSFEFKKDILNRLVNTEIIYRIGIERGIDQEEEIQKAPQSVQRALVIQKVAGELEKNIVISPEEIKKYYAQNKDSLNLPLFEAESCIGEILKKSKLDKRVADVAEGFKSRVKVEIHYELLKEIK